MERFLNTKFTDFADQVLLETHGLPLVALCAGQDLNTLEVGERGGKQGITGRLFKALNHSLPNLCARILSAKDQSGREREFKENKVA